MGNCLSFEFMVNGQSDIFHGEWLSDVSPTPISRAFLTWSVSGKPLMIIAFWPDLDNLPISIQAAHPLIHDHIHNHQIDLLIPEKFNGLFSAGNGLG